jgi:hypothetical protein
MQHYDLKPGDVIGFSGFNLLSAGINIATYGVPCWSVSHVGIVARAKGGRLLLWESTTLNGEHPCLIKHENICGTQAHSPEFIVGQYRGGAWHYPLYRELYPHESVRLTNFLYDTVGTKYDTAGALRAGGMAISCLESLFRQEDLSTLFCSEWVAASLKHVGILQTGSASGWSPNYLCRYLRRRGAIGRPKRLPVLPNHDQYEKFALCEPAWRPAL